MSKIIRASVHVLLAALVVSVAAAEVTWMGERVSAHRAAHYPDRAPGKIINLPLTGMK